MPNSPRMSWPYPSENQNPWFDPFEDFVTALDSSVYASREDRGIVLTEGGTISWNAGTSTLSWSAAVKIISPISGYMLQISAQSVTIDDGQVLYAPLVRAPLASQTLAVAVAAQVPSDDVSLLLAVRLGTKIYWRNGQGMADGETLDGFGSGGGGGGGIGAGTYIYLGPHSYTQAIIPVEEVFGQFVFDGSLVGTATPSFVGVMTPVFTAVGWARLRLYDMGPVGAPGGVPRLVAVLERTVSGLMNVSQTLTVVAAAPGTNQIWNTERVYELVVIQDSTPGDIVYVGSAGLKIV